MENILALDLSTKRSGFAYYDENKELKYGAIAANDTKVEKRIIKMREAVVKLIKENNITKIIAEEVRPDGLNNRTGKVLTWLQGCIAVAAYETNPKIEIEFIGASSWRSKLGLQGKAVKREQQKILDIKYVKDNFNIDTLDDEADAICILTAYYKTNPESIIVDGFEFK